MRAVETVLALVVLATAVAASARWLRAPAPSLLVAAGLVVGLLPGVPTVQVTPDVVGLLVLPPLLYAAGEELPWRDLRAVLRPVTVLAVGLVLASAAAVGVVAALVTPLPPQLALVLGTVLASTDPVAVTALGRRLSLPPRLQVGAVSQTVIFLLESVVFGIIGLELPTLIRQLDGADRWWWAQVLVITVTLLAVRVLWVFPLSAIAQRRRGAGRPSWQVPAVVSWAGARGVVPLAAALSIPLTTVNGSPLPHRDLVLVLATG